MGVIYRADDLTLHRPVALKFLSHETASDEEYRARFLREARVAAALNHPNTCTVYEVGQVESAEDAGADDPVAPRGTPFIAMEFIEGETLASRLARVGRLASAEALDVASQIAEGLTEAHARGIVHRDLKPQNIMITPGGLVKIVDFGLAKPLQARSAHALVNTADMISADLGVATIVGTCAYMSPEQAAGRQVDARSDIFAFGTILYQMLSGEPPFRGDAATVILAKILETEPDTLAADGDVLHAALAAVARRCLEKLAENRYSDARSLLLDLENVRTLHGQAASSRRRSTIPVRSALLAVALAAIGLIYAWNDGSAIDTVRDPSKPTDAPPPDSPAASATQAPVDAPQPAPTGVIGRNAAITAPAASRKVTAPEASSSSETPLHEPPVVKANVGTLILDSDPKASVSVDGNLVGITPLTVDASPGTHQLVMTSPDGLRWRGRVDVTQGGETRVERNLGASGQLTITSEAWVEVSLDGGPTEQTPVHFSRVPAGLHELRAFREGFVTQTLEIFIEEDKTRHMRVKLERKP